ncbi:MAG: fibronectin type III domain-containing protein [Candidatus Latescibacteria bacterium]|nr:fibronectin type III domain-containing protein [Candidatus Latescibacterota bacterium]
MAIRKHLVLVCALLAVSLVAFGCAEDAAAPNANEDEAPVLAPTNLQAVVINGGDIQISWNASSQPNVRGYNVYRVDNIESSIERLNGSPLEVTSVVDGGARFGREYDYRVTAVSTKHAESAFASVTIRNREAPPSDRNGDNPVELD